MKERRGGLEERPWIETRGVKHEENHNLGDTQEELKKTKRNWELATKGGQMR
jgi:hypothetical protein